VWVKAVNAAGDTMSGLLVLSGDPTAALGAATKQYVDAHAAGLTDAPSDGTLYGRKNLAWVRGVQLAGDAMTGLLVLSGDPTAALGAATKQYMDSRAVRYDTAQSLAVAQMQQGRQNIRSAPFDAYAAPQNLVINGSHEVSQFSSGYAGGITGGSASY